MNKFEFLIIVFVALVFFVGLDARADWQQSNHAYQLVLEHEADYQVPGTIILMDQDGKVQDIGRTEPSLNGMYHSHYLTNNLIAAQYNYLVSTDAEMINPDWTIIRMQSGNIEQPLPVPGGCRGKCQLEGAK